jgi:Zn-dependent metalloprotease
MRTIQQQIPGFIPDYMLGRLAEHQESREIARGTLEAMAMLANHRARAEGAPQQIQPVRKRRSVYDARNQTRLPGWLVMSEHKARGNDVIVNLTYDSTGRFYDFLFVSFGWSSFDGRGARIMSTVHFNVHFCNAEWDGRYLILGDGDDKIFKPFAESYDVIAHELGHAVIQYKAGLGYYGETGALNEHLADVIGSLADQCRLGQTVDQADWLIGRNLFYPIVHGVALRSMALPGSAYNDPILGKDPQPAHMRDYVDTEEDNGGVHSNSGILNKGYHDTSMRIGGRSWEKSGQIWMGALELLSPNADFMEFVRATVEVAFQKFNRDAQEAVAAGWTGVGLPPPPSATARHFAMKPPRPALRAPKSEAKKWRQRPAV